MKGGANVAQSRIGIMGGSFNPIHRRHLQIADNALAELKLDRVLFIPNGNPPHKRQGLINAVQRYEMTRLAVIPYQKFTASDVEIARDGVVYTVDTLALLHRTYPDAEFVCLIGEDTLFDLKHWRQPQDVFRQCSFAVCLRSGQGVQANAEAESLRAMGAKIQFLSLAPVEISSSDIRRKLAAGEAVDALLTPEVLEYVRIAGLYGCTPYFEGAEHAYAMLKADLSDGRLVHSMSSARTAKHLADIHGPDPDACELAGLLHDCAKCMPLKTLQQIACDRRLALSDIEMQSNALLHGPVGAVIAKEKYGIQSPEILGAISAHTTGRAGMTQFDMIIFLADKIEPYRHDIPALDEIRALADTDLPEATYQMLLHSKAHLLQAKKSIHPQTDRIIQWVREASDERRGQRT